MNNIQELIKEAREVGTFLGPVNGGTILLDLADALEALNRENEEIRPVSEFVKGLNGNIDQIVAFINERDALRAQLGGMTTEWSTHSRPGSLNLLTPITEAQARREADKHEHLRLVNRLVGPWVEVSDE